nr:uncharacterized protein LOC107130757 [Macaca fascicularis]
MESKGNQDYPDITKHIFCSGPAHWGSGDATETCEGDAPGRDRGSLWEAVAEFHPRAAPHPARRPQPAHRPADPTLRAQGHTGSPRTVPEPPPRAEPRTAAASPPPGAGNGGVRLSGANSESRPREDARGARRRRQPLAAGAEEWKLPQYGPDCEAVGSGQSGRSRAAEQVQRGGGYRSALRPIVSLPRGSRRSRAREPGSSPARHLLPPLWKRPPPPRAARPGPRLRVAGPARLTGRRQPSPQRPRPPPSWRGPFPAARARRSRAPAVRAPARLGDARPGLQVPGAPRREAGAGSSGAKAGLRGTQTSDIGVPSRQVRG